MYICDIDNNITLYDINNIQKFEIVRENLMVAINIMDSHKVLSGISTADYAEILRSQISKKYDKFKLLVALDRETKNVVGYIAAFIAIHDNQKPVCLIYGAYFFPMLLQKILPIMLEYLDKFSIPFGCSKTVFATTRNSRAYKRLFEKSNISFKPTQTVFERNIEHGN